MPREKKSTKATLPSEESHEPDGRLDRDRADQAAIRQEPEDKRATARETTPAGKGRSQ